VEVDEPEWILTDHDTWSKGRSTVVIAFPKRYSNRVSHSRFIVIIWVLRFANVIQLSGQFLDRSFPKNEASGIVEACRQDVTNVLLYF
jgi:hypothetical protein